MTVELIIVSYDGNKRIEEPWETIPKEKQKKIGAELTARFMQTAGYSPAVPA